MSMRTLPRRRSSAAFTANDRTIKLFACRQQSRPVLERPSVILRVGDFHAVGMESFECGNHLLQVIDVLTVHHQVSGESNAMLVNPSRHFHLVGMGARARDPVRCAFGRILETELDMVESRLRQSWPAAGA